MEAALPMYQFFSWNVDGYTQEIHHWLQDYLETNGPDVVFLSETKRSEPVLRHYFDQLKKYRYLINAHIPAQHHGVAMLIKDSHQYLPIPIQMNISVRKDTKSTEAATGRLLSIQLNEEVNVIGSYTPNSGSDLRNLGYRTKIWDPAFFQILEILRANKPTLWMGDINVALSELDVSNPVGMSSRAGFTRPERTNFASLLATGHWVDPWRLTHPDTREYTWVGRVRRLGYGMRIDNIIVSETLLPRVEETYILSDAPTDTDHLPLVAHVRR